MERGRGCARIMAKNCYSNQTVTGNTNQATTQQINTLSLFLGHTLSKTDKFGDGILSKRLNQTLTTTESSTAPNTTRLVTNGSLNWRQSQGKVLTIFSLGATDYRTLVGILNNYQMINLQASSSEQVSNFESLMGNLTVQATHKEIAGLVTADTITPNAMMTYSNNRAFHVRRLTFVSLVRIADTNISRTQTLGYTDTPTRSWENDFTYNIGRTSVNLTTRVAVISNSSTSSIILSLSRAF